MRKTSIKSTFETESAIIIGASLSGLMTGISLAREGLHVTILEKAGEEQRTGSALQVNSGTFTMTKTEKRLRKLASNGKRSIQLWSSIESRLRTEALTYPNITIHYNTRVLSVNQDEEAASAVTNQGVTIHANILIGADGHRSMVRRYVAPHKPDAAYAGYIVWVIDTVNELDLPKEHRPILKDNGVTMLNGPNGFLFGNIIDAKKDPKGSTSRRIGCAWYDNSRSDVLKELGCVQDGVVHYSLKGPDIPNTTLNELASLAQDVWPEPWLSATLHALNTRTLTGIPIKEYVPDNLVKGRIALVGDAAHIPAPITASGFNESLNDAVALGKSVAQGIDDNRAIEALQIYEKHRLHKVRQMVQSGQSFSHSFGRR